MAVLDGLTLVDNGAYATNGTNLSTNPKGTAWYNMGGLTNTLQYWSGVHIAASGPGSEAVAVWTGANTYTLYNDRISVYFNVDFGTPLDEFQTALWLRIDDLTNGVPNAYVAIAYQDATGNNKVEIYWTAFALDRTSWVLIADVVADYIPGDRFSFEINQDQRIRCYINETVVLEVSDFNITWPGYPAIGVQDTYAGINSVYYGDFTTFVPGTNYTKIITQSVTTTPSLRSASNKSLTRSIATTPTLSRATARTINRPVTGSPSLGKTATKPLSATVNTTATLVKSIARTITRAVTATPTLGTQFISGAGAAFVKTITVTVNTAVSLRRDPGKVITRTVTSVPNIVRNTTRALTRSVTITPSLNRATQKSLSVPVATLPVLTRSSFKTLQVIQAVSPDIKRATSRVLIRTVTTTATIARNSGKVLQAAIATNVTQGARDVLKNVNLTVVTTPTLNKAIRRTLSVVQAVLAQIGVVSADDHTPVRRLRANVARSPMGTRIGGRVLNNGMARSLIKTRIGGRVLGNGLGGRFLR
jgi:hypothetical protein